MTTRISRRRLASVLAAAAPALAVSPVTAQVKADDEDQLAAARERARKNGEQLKSFEMPMATEPAFKFTA